VFEWIAVARFLTTRRRSLVKQSPIRSGRSLGAPGPARAALAAASLPKSKIAVLVVALLLALTGASSADAAVYWGNAVGPVFGVPGTTIGRANNDGTGINQNFIGGASTPSAVAVDAAHVYWINDDFNQSIGRANLDGTGVNQRFITGVNAGTLAVDGAHIYWSDVVSGDRIGRANLDGTGVQQAFITGAHLPSGIAVDRAHVYWTNSDTHAIGRANLDGTGVNQSFFDVGGVRRRPTGLAVDAAHLYWADINATAIGRANIDGTGVNPEFVQAGDLPFGVAVDSAHIYWTNQFPSPDGLSGGTIGRANLDGTGVTQTFLTGLADPIGVAVDVATQAAQPSRVSIGDVRMAEGNAGQTAFRFTVSLDQAQSAPVTVDFATADGTATAPGDYTANTGTVTFAPGETAKTVTVQVNGDTRKEPDETFSVNLSNAAGNATLADGNAVGTIANDDRRHGGHTFSLGKAQPDPTTGTARLAVTVPGPGRLAISGPGVTAGAMMARSVRTAGTMRLLLSARGNKQRTLNRTGTVTIRPRVTYTAIGGTPRTRSKHVRLRKR
jgi:virginiamycin B lyase